MNSERPDTFWTQLQASDEMMKSTPDSPILVTGAAGAIGAIGRNLTAMEFEVGLKAPEINVLGITWRHHWLVIVGHSDVVPDDG
jgi:hypothetical protein